MVQGASASMRLVQKQGLRLVMTPQLQQAIQLLQLSTLELQARIQEELEQNPFLEETAGDNAETPGEPAAALDVPAAPPAAEPVSKETSQVDEARTEDLPFDLTAAVFDWPEERTPVSTEEREEMPFENLGHTETSLSDHLLEQLRLATDDEELLRLGEGIIGNLDDDGYLRAELHEVAEACGATEARVEEALRLVQGFDPLGVAARSIQECLLLQLRREAEPDPVSVEIVEQHFDDLARRRYADIARALKLSLDRIMESIEEIQALEPKPGRQFTPGDARPIAPDVTIQKVDGEYVVLLNDEGIPRLRVNRLYGRLLRGSAGEDRAFVESRLRAARWLIQSVEQRQRTLRKVATSLVKFQRDFLDRGVPSLRPLALRDVADDIAMHESTVSRVTTNKYVETPQGLFELKYFFHSGIASKDGEMVSSVSVRKMIHDLVAAEDDAKPLSDQEIAKVLHDRGLTIARRTVAKYREELGILPSHQRRLGPKKR
jgi:RNA polymerase sigma-54 factor